MRCALKLDQLPDAVSMAVDTLLAALAAAQSRAQIELDEVRQRGFRPRSGNGQVYAR